MLPSIAHELSRIRLLDSSLFLLPLTDSTSPQPPRKRVILIFVRIYLLLVVVHSPEFSSHIIIKLYILWSLAHLQILLFHFASGMAFWLLIVAMVAHLLVVCGCHSRLATSGSADEKSNGSIFELTVEIACSFHLDYNFFFIPWSLGILPGLASMYLTAYSGLSSV